MQTIGAKDKRIAAYHRDLGEMLAQGAEHEGATSRAFETLLREVGREFKWTLVPQLRLNNGRIPDGTLRDTFNLPRGYWEAKDTRDDLDAEIRKKIAAGYPTFNIIFEDTREAVLYQGGREAGRYQLHLPQQVGDLLTQFFNFTETAVASFTQAVDEFRERIPELATGLMQRIQDEHAAHNPAFRDAWASFMRVCQEAINPQITSAQVDEMLVQHLLTERLFRTVFQNPDFTRRNVIAAEIEKVIDALASRAFDRAEFLRSLDRFYLAIEDAARGLTDWSQKQAFMNTVYERFFQGFSQKQADTHGIVYTPQEIVDFMCASVAEVVERELGTTLSTPGVQILDPCTGTGNFIANLVKQGANGNAYLDGANLERKYKEDLFANEIMLLPYYIAALNIEHAYYERTGAYAPFEGLCFVDTLDLADRVAHEGLGERSLWITERNAKRVEREQDAKIVVILGNPPYNVGQENENDNNKNRRYPVIDARVRDSYAKDSKATNKNSLSDAYVRFFRWATDRLQGRDGVVCFVSNNSFVDNIAFDGMRQHLMQDFTAIYHLDLHGNVRKNPKLSGTTHNVFGIQVGVGITIAVRAEKSATRGIFYYRVPEDWRKEQKLQLMAKAGSLTGIEWRTLVPDERATWLTEGLRPEFATFLPIGSKEAKASDIGSEETIFATYGGGVKSNRDQWVYDYQRSVLTEKVQRFIKTYNAEVDRWRREGNESSVDDFVTYDDSRIKWSRDLKLDLQRGHFAEYNDRKIKRALYRPYCAQWLFLDRILNEEVYQEPRFFPTPKSEQENMAVWVKVGTEWPMFSLGTSVVPDLLPQGGSQVFPLYAYDEDGTNRRENITDWALAKFQAAYGPQVTRRAIFAYVYAILHHPQYRERYAENLKRELPRIPLLPTRADFETCVGIGEGLLKWHLGYESVEPWPLKTVEAAGVPVNWRVEKMRLSPDKATLTYNEWLTLEGIPPEVARYRLGNRSALEWVVDQYQVSTDKRSQITSDPNRPEEPRYIAELVGRVVRVSVETVRLVEELAARVDLLAAVGMASTSA